MMSARSSHRRWPMPRITTISTADTPRVGLHVDRRLGAIWLRKTRLEGERVRGRTKTIEMPQPRKTVVNRRDGAGRNPPQRHVRAIEAPEPAAALRHHGSMR